MCVRMRGQYLFGAVSNASENAKPAKRIYEKRARLLSLHVYVHRYCIINSEKI